MFASQVVVQYWPTGWAWLFQVDALTAGTVGFQAVSRSHGTGLASREQAERAGRREAESHGFTAPRVVHC